MAIVGLQRIGNDLSQAQSLSAGRAPIGSVVLRKQKNHPHEGVELLSKDSDDVAVKAADVKKVNSGAVFARSFSYLTYKQCEIRCHDSPPQKSPASNSGKRRMTDLVED